MSRYSALLVIALVASPGFGQQPRTAVATPTGETPLSAEAARAAWEQNRVTVLLGDLLRAPVAKESCGVVTMFHVLEHLPDPGGFLRAARALLRPGGRLVVQVPNLDCWQYRLLGRNWNGVWRGS